MCILALADDMTGALETGAKFRAAGIEAVVSAKPVAAAGAQALVLDTETRHLNAAEARRVVREFVTGSGIDSPRLVYKKTDSTLRGNISAELESLAELYPDWRIGYAPAYPALGRTVKSGVLYVDGIPVSETEFASDGLNPVATSSIRALLHPALPCSSASVYPIVRGDERQPSRTLRRTDAPGFRTGMAGASRAMRDRRGSGRRRHRKCEA